MGTIFFIIGTFLLVLVCVVLTLVVLMQRANTQGGLGTAFGGGVAESAFGTDTGNILSRMTIYASIAFFILSLVLYLGHMHMAYEQEDEDIILPDMIQDTTTEPSGVEETATESEAVEAAGSAAEEAAGNTNEGTPAE